MVSVPVRAVPVFAATEYVTVPFPVPGLPLVTVIHATLLMAAHAQGLPVITLTEFVLVVALTETFVADNAQVQT